MRAGNLEIIAGPCQFLPAMSEDRRSFAWTAVLANLMISLLNRSQRISARGIYIPLGLLNNARSGGNFSCTDDTVS